MGGEAVVDLGCGDGFWLDIVAPRYEKAIGIDVSTERQDRRKQEPKGWEFLLADLSTGIPLRTESIDAAHANQVIEHIRNPLAFALEVRRVLRPGGIFVATTPNVRYARHLARLVVRGQGPLTSARPDNRTLEQWDDGHLHYLTPHDLEWIAGHAGFASSKTSALIDVSGSLIRPLLDRWSHLSLVKQFLSGNTVIVARA